MGAACAAASRTGAFGLIRLVREQIVAQADALAADIDPGANDHALHFVLMLSLIHIFCRAVLRALLFIL